MSLKNKMIRRCYVILEGVIDVSVDPAKYGLHKLSNTELDNLRDALENLSNKALTHEQASTPARA